AVVCTSSYRALSVADAVRLRRPRRAGCVPRLSHLLSTLMAAPMTSGVQPGGDPALRVVGLTLSAVIMVAAIVAALYVTRIYYVYPRTDDAYVRANMIAVAPPVTR